MFGKSEDFRQDAAERGECRVMQPIRRGGRAWTCAGQATMHGGVGIERAVSVARLGDREVLLRPHLLGDLLGFDNDGVERRGPSAGAAN